MTQVRAFSSSWVCFPNSRLKVVMINGFGELQRTQESPALYCLYHVSYCISLSGSLVYIPQPTVHTRTACAVLLYFHILDFHLVIYLFTVYIYLLYVFPFLSFYLLYIHFLSTHFLYSLFLSIHLSFHLL